MKNTIFKTLLRKTQTHVKNFHSDFDIDKKVLETYPNRPFIHMTRKNGTSLVILNDFTEYPKEAENVPYLFAKADRKTILKGKATTLNFYLNLSPKTIFYFDGKTLVQINKETAINVFNKYERKILSQFENDKK